MRGFKMTLLCYFTFLAFSYGQVQVLKGRIIDQQSEMPLIGATVELINQQGKGTTTDVDGYFRLEAVLVGRQAIRVSYLGYDPVTISNIVVTSGKEAIVNVGLEESFEQLSEVVVKASKYVGKDRAQNEMATISARQFSLEEVNRYSGGRSDVARLAGNFAGVSTADDSRNDIVIRGNSPTGVLWRLEGIPIPSPNHFATLGTTGGPVSALNPNLLKNSDFLTSAFPAEYGDALAGVFDLGFRSGNKDEYEFTAQIGAVSGVELMAEGPLNKKHNSSFIVAGRYSFVGLASDAGIPVGTNATPNYQDIGFKIDFANTKIGKFTLFGMGGKSDIEFLGEEIDEDDLFAAEDSDAFAESIFGVVGLKHNYIVDNNTYIRTVIAASTSGDDFNENRYLNFGQPDEFQELYTEANNRVNRYSVNSFINRKFNVRFTARLGILAENFQYDIEARDRENQEDADDDGIPDLTTLYSFDESATLLQAYMQGQYKLSEAWTLNLGVHSQYLELNGNFVVEPRAALNWDFAPNQTLSLGYGVHHQTQPIPILLLQTETSPGVVELTNKNLDFTRSTHYVLGYDWRFAPSWRSKVEVYYQDISQAAVEPIPGSFSILNVGADFGFPTDRFNLVNEGSGSNMGVELTVEKFFSNGYYSLLTASVFDSQYKGSDGMERNTAFNNQYVLNVLAGKEFKVGKDKRNAITFDTKLTLAGGRPFTPIDLEASRMAGREILVEEEAFSERVDDYLRWDVKVGFQINSPTKKLSHRFFLDIQNVLNRDNVFIRRYNRVTNVVNEVLQLGLFPDFLYRLQF